MFNAGDTRGIGLILGLERPPGVGNGNLFQYSDLENSMNREAWWARIHGTAESDMTCTHTHACAHTHVHTHTHTHTLL